MGRALPGMTAALAALALLGSGLHAPAAAAAQGDPGITEADPAGFLVHRQTVDLAPPGAATTSSADSGGASIELRGDPEQVVLELDTTEPATLALRVRDAEGWSPWQEVAHDPAEAPDGLPGEEGSAPTAGIGPIWVGHGAQELELAVLSGPVRSVQVVGLESTVDPPAAEGQAAAAALGTPAPDAGPPPIRPRSAWATAGWASQNGGCGSGPRSTSKLHGAVVHHTVSVNDYSPADVPAMIRGIYWFHTGSRGWCDIAYNVVVDRFGQIWEARSGGLDKAVIGGHTRGFNTGTFGIVALGQHHSTASPPAATPTLGMLEAISRVAQWKLSLHGAPVAGTIRMTSLSDGDRFLAGQVATVNVLSEHRDLARTACPGDLLHGHLGLVRARMAALGYAHALFRTFVGRSPTDAERVDLASRVGSSGRFGAALQLSRSEAWAGAMVDRLYADVLGRPADAAGRRFWLQQLVAGTRFEHVAIQLYGSPEYFARSGGPAGFVTRLYRALLHREPDGAGLEFWTARLAAGTPPAQVVAGFYASHESRMDRVTATYRAVLGRKPDRPGALYWAERLLDTDDIVLAAHLASSDEFYNRAVR